MKKILITILLFFLSAVAVFATNTHTTSLNGTNQFWDIADVSQTGLDPTDFTLEAWIYPDDSVSTQMIVGKDTNGSRGYNLFYEAGEAYRFATNVGSSYSCGAKATSTQWTYVAITYKYIAHLSSITRMYINGYPCGQSTAQAGPLPNNTASFNIGSRQYPTSELYFAGDIDNVRAWSDVRTDAEILASYNCAPLTDTDNLISEWLFDNDGDDTQNTNDLVNNNSATFQTGSLPFTASCGGGASVLVDGFSITEF